MCQALLTSKVVTSIRTFVAKHQAGNWLTTELGGFVKFELDY